MPSAELVLVERDEAAGTALVTLNRPEARNALSRALLRDLRSALAELAADETLGAVVLTGADPAFCAGLDLKELSTNEGSRLLEEDERLPPGHPWEPLPVPVIGAVNGVAVTGGLELALNCDFLVASERARFADTHARVGILPGWGLSVLLPQRVGIAMARRMSLTGDYMDAATAERTGLVTAVYRHDELVPAALSLAATIAANNRPAVRALLSSYREVEEEVLGDGRRIEVANSVSWRRQGGADGLAGRVGGVFERGRSQVRG